MVWKNQLFHCNSPNGSGRIQFAQYVSFHPPAEAVYGDAEGEEGHVRGGDCFDAQGGRVPAVFGDVSGLCPAGAHREAEGTPVNALEPVLWRPGRKASLSLDTET